MYEGKIGTATVIEDFIKYQVFTRDKAERGLLPGMSGV